MTKFTRILTATLTVMVVLSSLFVFAACTDDQMRAKTFGLGSSKQAAPSSSEYSTLWEGSEHFAFPVGTTEGASQEIYIEGIKSGSTVRLTILYYTDSEAGTSENQTRVLPSAIDDGGSVGGNYTASQVTASITKDNYITISYVPNEGDYGASGYIYKVEQQD